MDNTTNIKIPKKYQHMLLELYQDSDGYWCYSADGYYFPDMECHTAHEWTVKDLLNVIRTVKPCFCDECKEAIKQKKIDRAIAYQPKIKFNFK
jgi:hypothetical protein